MVKHWKQLKGASAEDKDKVMVLASEIEKLAQELVDRTDELKSELKVEKGAGNGVH